MRTTSAGIETIISPLRLNMTTMVNNSAIKVRGLMRGMNDSSYQFLPLRLNSEKRVMTPAAKGTPR